MSYDPVVKLCSLTNALEGFDPDDFFEFSKRYETQLQNTKSNFNISSYFHVCITFFIFVPFSALRNDESFGKVNATVVYRLNKDLGPITSQERSELLPAIQDMCKDVPINRIWRVEVSKEEFMARGLFTEKEDSTISRVKRRTVLGCRGLGWR